jgi:opacity protein-like surface antigen
MFLRVQRVETACVVLACALNVWLAASRATADEAANDSEPWSIFTCCGQDECRDCKIRGWLSQGFTWNPDDPRDRSNGTQGMNDRANDYQFSQLGMFMQRELGDDAVAWDFGWRADVMFGSDARFVQSRGFDDDWVSGTYAAWAIPQLYAEVLLPGERGCSVQVGRFWTPLGYDGIPAAERFFYSVTNTYMFAEPSTHWGALGKIPLTEQWTAQAGIVNGWDVFNDNNDSPAFLGTLGWTSEDEATTATAVLYMGDNSDTLDDNQMSYSLILKQVWCDRWTFLFWHDLGCAERIATSPSGESKNAQWYGVNNYLQYAINEQVSVGGRFEWFRDDDGVLLKTVMSDNLLGPGDLFSLTAGVNYSPRPNWTLRPEVRYDWANRVTPFDDLTEKHQWTIAADLITRF